MISEDGVQLQGNGPRPPKVAPIPGRQGMEAGDLKPEPCLRSVAASWAHPRGHEDTARPRGGAAPKTGPQGRQLDPPGNSGVGRQQCGAQSAQVVGLPIWWARGGPRAAAAQQCGLKVADWQCRRCHTPGSVRREHGVSVGTSDQTVTVMTVAGETRRMSEADRAGLAARSPEGHAAKSMHIRGREEEWIQIQANTFKNWVNVNLRECGLEVEDMTTDFTDGVR